MPVYEPMMKHLFFVSNSTAGVNQHCIAATPKYDAWKCNFAQNSYAHTQAPIFALNSALDSWQSSCIYTATLDPGFPKTTPPALDEHGNCANAGADFSSAKCKGKPRASCAGPSAPPSLFAVLVTGSVFRIALLVVVLLLLLLLTIVWGCWRNWGGGVQAHGARAQKTPRTAT